MNSIPFIDYNSKNIYYQIRKVNNGKGILFIHGSGSTSKAWKFQMELDVDYNLFALDLPSHNKSDDFSDLNLELYVDIIKKAIETLNFDSVILCGQALGGAVIQEFYYRYPEKISGLILIATGAKLRVSPYILDNVKNNYQEFLNSLPAGIFYRKTSPEIVNEYVEDNAKIKPEVTLADFTICDQFDVMDKVGSIKIPCLIIFGVSDKITPVKYGEFFHNQIENSEFIIIKRASHMVMLDQPEEVNHSIKKFIEKL